MHRLWLLAALLLTLPATARAMDVAGNWSVRSGTIKYEVTHLLHSAVGVSKAVAGKAECTATHCRFHIRVPVASFDSQNAERDADMRAVAKAVQFPQAEVIGEGKLVGDGQAVLQGEIHFAGATVPLPPTRFDVEHGWWSLRVRGSFSLSLERCGIPRPALLGVPVADSIRIYVELQLGSA